MGLKFLFIILFLMWESWNIFVAVLFLSIAIFYFKKKFTYNFQILVPILKLIRNIKSRKLYLFTPIVIALYSSPTSNFLIDFNMSHTRTCLIFTHSIQIFNYVHNYTVFFLKTLRTFSHLSEGRGNWKSLSKDRENIIFLLITCSIIPARINYFIF